MHIYIYVWIILNIHIYIYSWQLCFCICWEFTTQQLSPPPRGHSSALLRRYAPPRLGPNGQLAPALIRMANTAGLPCRDVFLTGNMEKNIAKRCGWMILSDDQWWSMMIIIRENSRTVCYLKSYIAVQVGLCCVSTHIITHRHRLYMSLLYVYIYIYTHALYPYNYLYE